MKIDTIYENGARKRYLDVEMWREGQWQTPTARKPFRHSYEWANQIPSRYPQRLKP